MKGLSFDLIISLIAGLFVCLVVFPMVALFTTTSVGGIGKPVQVFRRFVGGLYQFSNIGDRGFAGMLFRHPGGLCIGNEGF